MCVAQTPGELIEQWHTEDPDQKVLIFSQFVDYLDFIGTFLQRRGVSFAFYVGKMSADERTDAIKEFTDPAKGIRVMLISLKCGGVGLNLTAANKVRRWLRPLGLTPQVICMDLAWSPAAEEQATSRAHRIG